MLHRVIIMIIVQEKSTLTLASCEGNLDSYLSDWIVLKKKQPKEVDTGLEDWVITTSLVAHVGNKYSGVQANGKGESLSGLSG